MYFGMVYRPLAHRDHLLRKKVRHAFRIVFYESKSMSELARATRKYQENSNEHKKNKLSKHTLRRYPQISYFFTNFGRFGVYFEAKIHQNPAPDASKGQLNTKKYTSTSKLMAKTSKDAAMSLPRSSKERSKSEKGVSEDRS